MLQKGRYHYFSNICVASGQKKSGNNCSKTVSGYESIYREKTTAVAEKNQLSF